MNFSYYYLGYWILTDYIYLKFLGEILFERVIQSKSLSKRGLFTNLYMRDHTIKEFRYIYMISYDLFHELEPVFKICKTFSFDME